MDKSTSRAAVAVDPAPFGPGLAAAGNDPPSTTMSRGVRFRGSDDIRIARQGAVSELWRSWVESCLHEGCRRVLPEIFCPGCNHYCSCSEPQPSSAVPI